jgi:hypothetical protein
MKKVISLLLAVVLVSGCGKSSVLPLPVPPPDITWSDDIKVSNPNNETESDNMPFWFKAELIAVSAIVISSIVFLGYNIVKSEIAMKRSAKLFERSKIEFACQMERWRNWVEKQKRHAGHQVNHPGFPIVHSDDLRNSRMK